VAVVHRVPFGAAAQSHQTCLGHIADRKISVQRTREVQGFGIGVADRQFNLQGPWPELDQEPGLEGLVPPLPGHGAVVQAQDQMGLVVREVGGAHGPGQVAGKAVLGQGATQVELRKTDRDAATDGRLAIHHAAGAEVQALASASHPRQDLGTVPGDDHTVSARQLQLGGGQARKHQIAAGGGAGHGQPFSASARACAAAKSRSPE